MRKLTGERFWEKVKITTPDECWLWQSGTDRDGYGQFNLDGITRKAHHIAYILTHGEIPEGVCICHNCPTGDNPACCNPAHLWLGTQQENMADMKQKGRSAKGIKNGAVKLTAAKVVAIRRQYGKALGKGQRRPGQVTQAQLATKYGVSQHHISRIVRGLWWEGID
jgi:hypothetical protein